MDSEEKRSSADVEVQNTVNDDEHDESKDISTFHTVGSDNPLFIRELKYTRAEEGRIIRTLDTRLFPWILLTTFVLNMDRTNHSNAISDNLPQDLGFTIDTVNLGTAIYSVLFSIFCFSGAVMAKIVGPSRCSFLILLRFLILYSIRDSNFDVRVGTSDYVSCSDT